MSKMQMHACVSVHVCAHNMQNHSPLKPLVEGAISPFVDSEVKVTQSCPNICGPVDYTVHGILQARILAWVAFPFSRGSSQRRDGTWVSHTAGRFFTC